MKRIINFTKYRFITLTFSSVLIVAFFVITFLQGGFNLGIDFKGGLSQQMQVAPAALRLSYTGDAIVRCQLQTGTLELTVGSARTILILSKYPTLSELVLDIEKVAGIKVEIAGDRTISPDNLLTMNFPAELTRGSRVVLNRRVRNTAEMQATFNSVSDALKDSGAFSLQVVGDPLNQEFLIRMEVDEKKDPATDKLSSFDIVSARIMAAFGTAFGAENVILKQREFVGPQLAQYLVRDSIFYIGIALVGILIYLRFRFKLSFGVGAIVATLHDAFFMIGLIGALRIEVNTATIAAILTIIGYSINDTVVVFDRIRENLSISPDARVDQVINSSATQTLSRTIITSLTTVIAIVPLFFLGMGVIRDFSFNMIVGIVVGTYSSIFIASPVVLGFVNMAAKRNKSKDMSLFHSRGDKPVKKAEDAEFEVVEDGQPAAAGEEMASEAVQPTTDMAGFSPSPLTSFELMDRRKKRKRKR